MMELHRENGVSFMPRNQFADERDYYAQVADLQAPAGTSDRLLTGMVFANRGKLSRYKKLLELDTEKWHQADVENWSLEMCLKQVGSEKNVDVASSNNRPN